MACERKIGLVPEQVLELHEDRPVCALQLLRPIELFKEAVAVDVTPEQVALLVVVVISDIKHGSGINRVVEQHIEVERPVFGVPFRDISKPESVRELERTLRSDDFDVELNFVVIRRIREPSVTEIEVSLPRISRTHGSVNAPVNLLTEERLRVEDLVTYREVATERVTAARVSSATDPEARLLKVYLTPALHVVIDITVKAYAAGEREAHPRAPRLVL